MPCSCSRCAPDPALPNGSPYTFSNFSTKTVTIALNGTQVNALFPLAVKVAEIDLQTNAGLISLTLASSVTLPVAGTVGIFAALADAQTVSVDALARLFLSHVSVQNSVPGVPNPSSRCNSLQMGQSSYYRVNQGQKIAIYASSPNDVTALMLAVVTAYWIPLE
jgi:hypothetical protein